MVSVKDTNYAIPNGAYFVSPDGNDTNSGTLNAPWLSLTKAIKSAPSASTVVMRGGTYREGDLVVSKKLTFQPYPHESVWFKGSIEVTGWAAEGAIWSKTGWNYKFPHERGPEFIDPNYPIAGNRDMVYINDKSSVQVANKTLVSPGKFYVDYAAAKLYIGDDPGSKTVEATRFESAFSLALGSDDSIVRGLGITHYAEEGLTVKSPRAILENNVFVWNGVYGLGVRNTEDVVVRNNTLSYNGLAGLNGASADRMLVEGNLLSYNNAAHYAKDWAAAGTKIVDTDSLVVRDNLVERNDSHGVWIDVSSTNATVVRNRVLNNQVDGIFFEISHKAIIASNLVVNSGRSGINVFDSTSAKVYNNTCSRNVVDINVADGDRVNDDPAEIAAGITHITANNVVKNNILSNTGVPTPEKQAFHLNVFNDEDPKNNRLVIGLNNNAYYRTTASEPRFVIRYRVDPALTGSAVNFESVSDFRSTSGTPFESNSIGIDGGTNPFFIDEANGNYLLRPSSPALGAGEPLPSDVADAIGVTDGTTVDLGVLTVVSIITPASGNRFTAGSTIPIIAIAFNNRASVAKVEFFKGEVKLGVEMTAPYSFMWQSVPGGSHRLTAKATDNQGVVTTSSPVFIEITEAPVVSIENPADGSVITADTDLNIRAVARDPDGSIAKVEFFQDGTKLGEEATAPYNFTWQNIPSGSHTLTAKATDNQGVATTSSPVSINVNKAPVVSIGNPADGAVIPAGADLNIRANARDPDGSIAKVEFFRGATKLGEDTTAPYSFTWQNLPTGSYILKAKAIDNRGGVTFSSPVSVTVRR